MPYQTATLLELLHDKTALKNYCQELLSDSSSQITTTNPGRTQVLAGGSNACCQKKDIQEALIKAHILALPDECSTRVDFPADLTSSSLWTFPDKIRVSAPARIDIAGGWTDTPPITYEMPNPTVVNAAIKIDGQRSITCDIHRLDHLTGLWLKSGHHPVRKFKTASEILRVGTRPSEYCSLLCATVISSGVFAGLYGDRKTTRDAEWTSNKSRTPFGRYGWFIECQSSLPHGCGLGTSSIIAGALLIALWQAFGKEYTDRDVVVTVLKVEQFLTTGGGWQDQIGGLIPGVKIGFIPPNGTLSWRQLVIPSAFTDELNSRLAVIYTGQTRLAKNLLQTVLLKWIYKDPATTSAIERIGAKAVEAGSRMEKGIFPVEQVEAYYADKKIVADNAEPEFVKKLIGSLKDNSIVEAAWLAGAGGGGFLAVWMSSGITVEKVNEFLAIVFQKEEIYAQKVEIDNERVGVNVFRL